ncbi:MAG: hypothetical protein U0905_14235 [Pirellulales bacterium]
MRNDNNPYAPVVQQTIAPKTPRGFLPAAFWIFWASATLLFCALLLTPAIPAGVLGITSSIITLAYSLAYANHIVRVQRQDCIEFLHRHPIQFTLANFALSLGLLVAGLIGFFVCCAPLTIGISITGIQQANEMAVIVAVIVFSSLAGIGTIAIIIRQILPVQMPVTEQVQAQMVSPIAEDPSKESFFERAPEKREPE